MTNKKGFTLIELLVVIALIGILSGFVFISVSDSTNTANDAKVKVGLISLGNLALLETIENTNLSEDDICEEIKKGVKGEFKPGTGWGGEFSTTTGNDNTKKICTSGLEEAEFCCESKGKKYIIWAATNKRDILGNTGFLCVSNTVEDPKQIWSIPVSTGTNITSC